MRCKAKFLRRPKLRPRVPCALKALAERISSGRDDGLVRVKPLIDRAPRFADLIGMGREPDAAFASLGRSELIGRPLGDGACSSQRSRSRLNRAVTPRKRGRKPRRAMWRALEAKIG